MFRVSGLQPTMEFDVVIAGGGFAGAYCGRALGRAFAKGEGEKRVALIAEQNVLVFQPMLAEVAGRLRRYQDAQQLLERCLELAPSFDAARHNYAVVLNRQAKPAAALFTCAPSPA